MDAKVEIRMGANLITTNENGELVFEESAGTKTSIPAPEVNQIINQAQSYEEAIELLQGSGANISAENSRVMIASTPGGTQIFFKDEPGRKIVLDKEVPEHVAAEILSVDIFDDKRAVEKILEANNIIDNREEELETTVSKDGASFELNTADNVMDNDITDGGAISQARAARDEREADEKGVVSEEMTREEMEKYWRERAAASREDRDMGDGRSR